MTLAMLFDRLKKVLEEGTEKGWWDRVTGTTGSGSYELLVDEFDPTDGKCSDFLNVLTPVLRLKNTLWTGPVVGPLVSLF